MKVTRSCRQAIARTIPTVAACLIIGIMPARSQDFETGKIFVCTNEIKSRTDACNELAPPFEHLDRRVFRNKRLDFKFTVFGQRAALNYLQDKNYLPVKVGVWRDGFRKDDDIALDISQSDWDANGEKLTGEFSEDGQFKWRTFFHINLHNAKTIRIEINDAQENTMVSDGNPARLSLTFAN